MKSLRSQDSMEYTDSGVRVTSKAEHHAGDWHRMEAYERQGVFLQGHPHVSAEAAGVFDQGHRSTCGCGQGVYHQGHASRSGVGEGVYHQGKVRPPE